MLNLKISKILSITFAILIFSSCSKKDEPQLQILETEGYLIGYHPCVVHNTVTTSKGQGKGYLVATITPRPDTLMVYGVPAGMFDIPENWFFFSGGYLFPEEGRRKFKVRIAYQSSKEAEIGAQHVCNALWPSPNLIKYFKPEFIVHTAKKLSD